MRLKEHASRISIARTHNVPGRWLSGDDNQQQAAHPEQSGKRGGLPPPRFPFHISGDDGNQIDCYTTLSFSLINVYLVNGDDEWYQLKNNALPTYHGTPFFD